MNHINTPKAGEIWIVSYCIPTGSKHEQMGTRPMVITSNNKRNYYSPTVKCVPLSTKIQKFSPVHVILRKGDVDGLHRDSVVLCEDKKTVDKILLIECIGRLSIEQRRMIAIAQILDEPDFALAFNSGIEHTDRFKEFMCFGEDDCNAFAG